MLWKVFVLPIISFIIGWLIIPKFYKFGKVSTFDFISATFSPLLSRIALLAMILGSIYYLSNVSYIPSLILNAATGAVYNVGLHAIAYT